MSAVGHPELLTSRQVAEMFQVSVATVSRWARDEQVRCIRTPAGRLRFRREDVEAFLPSDGNGVGGEAA
jgi:excisionase family DNA binding protein